MNITGKFMRVWKVEESGNYTKLDLGDSRKNKDGEYDHCTWFGCLLLGDAAKKEVKKGDTVEITSGQIFMRKYLDKWYVDIKIWHMTVTEGEEKPPESSGSFKPFKAPPFGGKPDDGLFKSDSGLPEDFEDDIPF